MFQVHLNVELGASRIGGIKNLFKYVLQGINQVTVQLVH